MSSKQALLDSFSEFIPFIERLDRLDEPLWNTPIAPGKWTVRDVVAHLYLWDDYFLENAVAKIADKQPLTLRHLDFDRFNSEAAERGKAFGKSELCALAVRCRHKLLELLHSIPESEYGLTHKTPDGTFVLSKYIPDFVWHDNHHKKQIESLLEASGEVSR